MKNVKNVSEKNTLNLAIRETKYRYLLILIPLLLILAAAAFFGWRHASEWQHKRLIKQKNRLEALEAEAEAMRALIADYDNVEAIYAHRSTAFMDANEKAIRDRIEILDLMINEFVPRAKVNTFAVSGNSLSISLSEISLEATSVLVQSLYANPTVQSVSVHTASSSLDGGNTSVTMYVTFKPKEVESK